MFHFLTVNAALELSLYALKCRSPFVLCEKTAIADVLANEQAVQLVNELLGIDLVKLVGTTVVFMPKLPWAEVWNGVLLPAVSVGKDAEELDSLRKDVLDRFAEL